MKWLRTLIVFDRGGIGTTPDWEDVHSSYVRSVKSIDFPEQSGLLTLRKKSRTVGGQWNRNGVGYLKSRFLTHLVEDEKWQPESGFSLGDDRKPVQLKVYPGMKNYREPVTSEFGNFDFVTSTQSGLNVAIEWETGNISSSHRSMNKLAIALMNQKIQVGVLILPSRSLYDHLTDRIGNIGELSGYLSMWKNLGSRVKTGLLAISVVEHDNLTDDVLHPYLSVGGDGRAREGATKRVGAE